jgi:uncharacterized protein DUF4019
LKQCSRLLVVVSLLAAFAPVAFSADEKEKAATDAAAQWLTIVDSRQYAESWFQAASALRNAVTKEQWKNALDSARAPLGKVVSRQFKSATYTTKLPNALAGEFVIIQYETSFEQVPGMIETVTPMLEKDGKWKVSGYYVKRAGG